MFKAKTMSKSATVTWYVINSICKNVLIIITYIKKTTTIDYLHNDKMTYKKLQVYYRNTITNLKFYLFIIFFWKMHWAQQ